MNIDFDYLNRYVYGFTDLEECETPMKRGRINHMEHDAKLLKVVGMRCKEYRETCALYQSDVAEETGYSKENVSSFETGRNNNAVILLWYIDHGLDLKGVRSNV